MLKKIIETIKEKRDKKKINLLKDKKRYIAINSDNHLKIYDKLNDSYIKLNYNYIFK